MISAEENMFQEAVKAIQDGERLRGKDLLTRLLKQNQSNPDYWLWMSAVVDTEKERRYCLNQTLKLDPDNSPARRGLILLGDLPVDTSMVIPYEDQKRNWKLPSLEPVEEPLPKIPWVKIGFSFVGLVAVIVLIVMALQSDRLWLYQSRNVAAIGTAAPTPTYPASATPTITLTPRVIEPTAPWNILQSTYTPTPIYVLTPHPIIEAFSIAMRNYQQQDWDETIKYLKQAIQTQPDAPDLHYHLGEVYFQKGDLNNALIQFEESITLNPDFSPGYYGRAKIRLLDTESIADGIEDLILSIDLDPEYREAYLLLIDAFIKVEELEKAHETIEIAEQLLVDSPLLDLAKGHLALSEGEFNRAIEFTQLALEKDLTLLAGYRLLGEIYQESNNAKASLEPLLIYYRYNKTYDPQSEILLANAYAANNRFDDAIQQLDTYLVRNPSYADGFLQRAVIYTQMEEFEKALEDFTVASKLEPRSFGKCISLSEAYFPINKPGNAYQQANECQKLADSDEELAHMFFVRAFALEALNNPVAKRDWERMLELDPDAIEPAYVSTAQSFLLNYYSPTPTITMTPEATQNTATPGTLTRTITPSRTFTITPTR